MVKLYALNILYKDINKAIWLKSSYDLQTVGFFQRGSVQEFMAFVSKTIVERTQTATRQSVKEGEYMCHVYVRCDNLAGVVISNHDYPHRVAHTLLTKVLDEFATKIPANCWPNASEASIEFPPLPMYLAKYQNPREADAMTKIQDELDETKIILVNFAMRFALNNFFNHTFPVKWKILMKAKSWSSTVYLIAVTSRLLPYPITTPPLLDSTIPLVLYWKEVKNWMIS